MEKLYVSFAGFRHSHAFALYDKLNNDPRIVILGAFEEDEQARIEAESRGVKFSYSSLDELINDKRTDAVIIGDCYGKRGNIAVRALAAGKHIFADKPLCTRKGEIEEIKKLCENGGPAVGVMFDMRNNPNIIAAGEIIESGRLGIINNIVFEAQHPLNYGSRPAWYFEEGLHGGTINDIAVHAVDLIREFTKSDVKKVVGARVWNFYADKCPDFKDSAQLMLKMGSGAGVIGDVSYASPKLHGYSHPCYWHFRIWGSEGLADFSLSSDGVTLYLKNSEEPEKVSGSEKQYDYFEDYLHAVNDEEYRKVYNEKTIKTSQQAIMIQSCAEGE